MKLRAEIMKDYSCPLTVVRVHRGNIARAAHQPYLLQTQSENVSSHEGADVLAAF
jgi:hypothetical protein